MGEDKTRQSVEKKKVFADHGKRGNRRGVGRAEGTVGTGQKKNHDRFCKEGNGPHALGSPAYAENSKREGPGSVENLCAWAEEGK